MNNRELADKLEELLTPEMWWDGQNSYRSGQFCLGMAASHILMEVEGTYSHGTDHLILDIAEQLFPGRSTRSYDATRRIPWFNDYPDTTYEDILLVIKHLRES